MQTAPDSKEMKVIAKNRRATFDYAIRERLTAGIVLSGTEVKSVRHGRVSLKGTYCVFERGELYLRGGTIAEYAPASNNHEPTRDRKLLLTKKQLEQLKKHRQNGLHIVPIAIGIAGHFIKLEIGIGRSKKLYDKRQTIKKRDDERRANRLK